MQKISTILILVTLTSILHSQEFRISLAPTYDNVFNYYYPDVYTTKAQLGYSTTIDYLIRCDKRISLGIGLTYHFCQVKMIPGKYSSRGPFSESINLLSLSFRSVYNMQKGFRFSLDPTLNFQLDEISKKVIDDQAGLGLSFGIGKHIRIKERIYSNFNPAFLNIEPRLWIHNIIPFHEKNHPDRLTIIGLNLGLVFWTKK
jgi:hypothetical protein